MRNKHLPKILIEMIEHKKQRYNTPGDYYKKGKNWEFKISKLDDDDFEFLCLIHELVEWHLTQRRGIKEEDITKFDIENPKLKDPGLSKEAPYHDEHMFSIKMEKAIAKKMGIKWRKYDKSYGKLRYKNNKKAF